MRITQQIENEKIIINLEGGFLNYHHKERFLKLMESAIKCNPEILIINMSLLKSISSFGIGALMHVYHQANEHKVQLSFEKIDGKVLDIFKTTKLDTVFCS